MTMFDSIIAEADEQYNLNGKAGTLLSALLALITDETRGGFAGFLDRFKAAGLGDAVSSWINPDENTDISNEELESVLGRDALDDISRQIEIDYEKATSATAFMIPRVVDVLTPDGNVPQDKDLRSRIGGFLTETGGASGTAAGETFDRTGNAAAPVLDEDKRSAEDENTLDGGAYPVVDRVDAAASDIAEDNHNIRNDSPLGWILPLLLLGLLLILGYWFCSKTPTPTTQTSVNSNQTVANAANQ